MVPVTVKEIRKIGEERAVLKLAPEAPFSYRAGQYIELVFNGLEPRPYSIANAPGHGYLEIHIKDNKHGGTSSHAVNGLRAGERVAINGPFGSCVYTPSEKGLLLIAGGMGIAPMMAIAEDAIARGHKSFIRLYWGTKSTDDVYLDKEIHALTNGFENFVYHHVHSQPVSEILDTMEHHARESEIYIAGPPEMVKAVVRVLIPQAIQKEQIHCDHMEAVNQVFAEPVFKS